MFFIENSQPAELEGRMSDLVSIIRNEDTESLRILALWFNGYLSHLANQNIGLDADAVYAQITSPM